MELPFYAEHQWQRSVGWQLTPVTPLIELDATPLHPEQPQLFQLPHLSNPVEQLINKLQRGRCPDCGAAASADRSEALQAAIERLGNVRGVLCLTLPIDAESAAERHQRVLLYDRQYILVDQRLERSDRMDVDGHSIAVVLATIELSVLKRSMSEIRRILLDIPQVPLGIHLISDRDQPATAVGQLAPSNHCSQCGAAITKLEIGNIGALLLKRDRDDQDKLSHIFSTTFGALIELLNNLNQSSSAADALIEFVRLALDLGLERLTLARKFSSLSAGERLRFAIATILSAPLYDAVIVSRLWSSFFHRQYHDVLAQRLRLHGCNFILFDSNAISSRKPSSQRRGTSTFRNQEKLEFSNLRLPGVSIASFEIVIGGINRIYGASGSGKSVILNQVLALVATKSSNAKFFECSLNKSPFRQVLVAAARSSTEHSTVDQLSGLTALAPNSVRHGELQLLLDQLGFGSLKHSTKGSALSDQALQRLLLVLCVATAPDRLGARRGLAKRGRLILIDDPGLACSEIALKAISAAIDSLIEVGDTVVVSDSIGFLQQNTDVHEISLAAC